MMRIDIMAGFSPGDVERAAAVLREGGVGVIPTDTVYGIAALARDKGAVSRVLDMKERPPYKPLPVQVASMLQADMLAVVDGPAFAALAEKFWPGPLTMVLPRKQAGPHLAYQGLDTIGLRMPDNMFCISLIEHAGYLVVPSANPPGQPSPVSLSDVSPDILGNVDFVVEGGSCEVGVESTVVDLCGRVRVLRVGAIPADEIYEAAEAAGEGRGDA